MWIVHGRFVLTRSSGLWLRFVLPNFPHSPLVGCLESWVTLFFATAAIAALEKFDVGPAMPAFFRLALTTVAVKSLLPNFPHSPPAITGYLLVVGFS